MPSLSAPQSSNPWVRPPCPSFFSRHFPVPDPLCGNQSHKRRTKHEFKKTTLSLTVETHALPSMIYHRIGINDWSSHHSHHGAAWLCRGVLGSWKGYARSHRRQGWSRSFVHRQYSPPSRIVRQLFLPSHRYHRIQQPFPTSKKQGPLTVQPILFFYYMTLVRVTTTTLWRVHSSTI